MLEQILAFFLNNNVFRDFPLEKDVDDLYLANYYDNNMYSTVHYINMENHTANKVEQAFSEYVVIYNDCKILYDNIHNELSKKELKSINDMIFLIRENVKVFLNNCLYKPLTYEECINP